LFVFSSYTVKLAGATRSYRRTKRSPMAQS